MNLKTMLIIILYLGTFTLIAFSKYSILLVIPIFLLYTIILLFIFKKEIIAIVANFNYAVGNGEKAEQFFIQATKNNTKNPVAYLNYAIMLSHRGEGLKAIELLEKAENLNPKTLTLKNILLTKATCYWVSGDIDNGINLLLNLTNNYEYTNPNALTTLGFLYILKNDFDNAVKYTNKAIKDDPTYLLAYDNLGQIEYRRGSYNKAEQYFTKVIEQYNYPDSLYYLALIHIHKNDTNKAKIYLEKASNCNITALNTVTKEMIKQKLNEL